MGVPSSPEWKYGYTPTPGEWNNVFAGKVDFPAPVDQGGTGGQDPYTGNYNLQQRQQIITMSFSVAPITFYSVRTDLTACTISLPAVASTRAGDWVDLFDAGANAATNNITINAAGADTITVAGTSGGSLLVTYNSARVILVSDGVSQWHAAVAAGNSSAFKALLATSAGAGLIGSLSGQTVESVIGPLESTAIPATDGYVLTSHGGAPAWMPAAAPSASAAWTLLKTWDFAVNGATATIDLLNVTNSEIMVACSAVTKSAASTVALLLSTNNGTSFYNGSGDYITVLNSSGGSNTATTYFTIATNQAGVTTTYCVGQVQGLNTVGPKMLGFSTSGFGGIFLGSTAVVNAVRVATAGSGTLFNGGKIYIYGRG